ncbi:hypothetical protein RKD20_004350 [Streptomyces sp. SLBN-8D4]
MTETARAVDHALRHAAEVVAVPDVDPRGIDDRLGRTIFPGPSGHVLAGFSTVAPLISPGCCTATSTRRSCTSGPQVSAPVGTVRNCLSSPRVAAAERWR